MTILKSITALAAALIAGCAVVKPPHLHFDSGLAAGFCRRNVKLCNFNNLQPMLVRFFNSAFFHKTTLAEVV